jgi:hypothetical protein
MTNADRIRLLEDQVAGLTAQIAGVIPVRLADAGGGADGAAGLFLCTLSSPVSPASLITHTMGIGTGVVYKIDGNAFTGIGTKTIFNPYQISLPATAATHTIIYTCQKTKVETDGQEKFTIVGIEPLHLLASLFGFQADKILYTIGPLVTDIRWGGKECPS